MDRPASRLRVPFAILALAAGAAGCSAGGNTPFVPWLDAARDAGDARADGPPGDLAADRDAPGDRHDAVTRDAAGPADVALEEDASCASAGVRATVERLPVDIIWVVDNSVSMAPAIDQVIAGLNRFASLVGERGLDYRVVMLSLRSASRMTTVGGAARYAVCIPRPLAGDDACGNGARFFHASVDVRSTQPLEQLLGTLGQTTGYTAADPRGGAAWRPFLRTGATKTIVVVTDDNSRLTANDFERFAGGVNPNSRSFVLPPGLLDPSWGGLFTGYTFSGIYGWGSETDPGVPCRYPSGSSPPSPGATYTTLVTGTRGARARICDGAAAWGPFFEAVATAVERASRVACDVAIPPPPEGTVFDARRINVALAGATRTRLGNVRDATACTPTGGWHYDDNARPTRVVLCPASCARAQEELRGGAAGVEVLFGCITIPG